MAVDTELSVRVKAHDDASRVIKGLESSIIRFVGAVAASLAAVKVIAFPITSATEFDAAMRNVQKTTNFTDFEIKELSASLLDMSKQMSVTAVELANISGIAGQLGLGRDGAEAIRSFTESVAKASVTLGLAEEQAANTTAQMLQIFNIPTKDAEKVISTVNALTNTSVANAQELLDITRRVGNIAGLSFQQAAALAAFARDIGETQEVAGTSFVKFFSNMQSKADKFAKLLNISQGEWIRTLKVDAVGALQQVASKLSELDAVARASSINTLLGQGRQFAVANKIVNEAANNFVKLNQHILTANESFESGTSSIEEYEKVMRGFGKQVGTLGNTISALSIESGTELLPQLTKYTQALQEFFNGEEIREFLADVTEGVSNAIESIAQFVGWVASLNVEWTNLITILELFVGLSLAKAILSMTLGLIAQGSALFTAAGSWGALVAYIKTYITASLAATVASRNLAASQGTAATAGAIAMHAAATATFTWGAALTSVGNTLARFLATAILGFRNLALTIWLSTTAYGGNLTAMQAIVAGLRGLLATISQTIVGLVTLRFSFTALFATLRGFAVRAAGALLGPLGIVLTTLFVFKDQILELLGFGDKAAKTAERNTKARIRQTREELEKTLNDFQRLTKEVDVGGEIGDLDIDATLHLQGVEGAQKEVANLAAQYSVFSEVVENAGKVHEIMNVSLAKYRKELTDANVALESASVKGFTGDTLKGLEQAAAAAKAKVDDYEASITLLDLRLSDANRKIDILGSTLASNATPELLQFVEAAEGVARLTTGLKDIEEQQVNLGRALKEARAGENAEETKKLEEAQKDLNGQTVLFTGYLGEQNKRMLEAKDKVGILYGELSTVVEGMASLGNVTPLKGLREDIEATAAAGELVSSEEQKAQMVGLINRMLLVKATTDRTIEAFKESRRGLDALAKSAKGAFDNLPKTLRGISREVRTFRDELSLTRKNATLDLELRIKDESLDKQLEKTLKDIEKKFARRRANVQNPADPQSERFLKRLEEEEEREVSLAKTRAQSRKDEAKATQLRKAQADNLEKYYLAVDAADVATKKLAGSEKLSAEQQGRLLAEQELARQKLKEAFDQAKESAKDLNEFAAVKPTFFSTDLQLAQQIIPDSEKEKVEKQFDAIGLSYATLTSRIVEGSNTLGKSLVTSLNEAIAPTEALNARAASFLDGMAARWEDLSAAISDASIEYEKLVKKTVDDGGLFKDLSVNLDLIDVPSTEEVSKIMQPGISQGVQDGIIAGFAGLQANAIDTTSLREAFRVFTSGIDFTLEPKIPETPSEVDLLGRFDGKQLTDNLEDVARGMGVTIDAVFQAKNTGGTIQKNADGGFIRGPGTGRSDSILSWLSNGEYVVDTQTTGFFGASFFKELQLIAKRGVGLKLPKFANGGPVSMDALPDSGAVLSSLGLGSGSGGLRETIDLVLRDPQSGEERGRLSADRRSADALLDVLKTFRRK
jgi:TP901 family phage tail tape measure protein